MAKCLGGPFFCPPDIAAAANVFTREDHSLLEKKQSCLLGRIP